MEIEEQLEMREIYHKEENVETSSKNTKYISKTPLSQITIVMITSFTSLSTSMSASLSAILVPQLKDGSNISLGDNTASWIASSYAFFGPIGCLLGGILADVFGRKKLNVIGSIAMITGWVLILVAHNDGLFIAARITEGICKGSLLTSVMVTIDEIADPKFRGSILCASYMAHALGVCLIAGLGAVVDWWTVTAVSIVFPVTLLLLCLLMPETPTWLVRKHRVHEAHRVLGWLWGEHHKEQANEELQKLVARFCPQKEYKEEMYQKRSFKKKIKSILQSPRKLLHMVKPFIVIHIFNTLQVVCGNGHFVFYSVEILSRVRRNPSAQFLDVYFCNFLLSIVHLILISATCIIIFHVGRRPVALISGLGSSASILTGALLLYLRSPSAQSVLDDWIIFRSIVLFIGFYTFGFSCLPTLMIGEMQTAELRSFMTGYIFTVNDLMSGAILLRYYSMVDHLGLQGLFLMFALACLVCTVFMYFFLPETHGKSLLEMEVHF